MLSTFNALLRISRIESGGHELELSVVDVAALLHDAMELYEAVAEDKQVGVTIDAQVQYAHSVSGGTSFLGNKIDQTSAILSMNVPIYQGGGVRSQVKSAGYDLEAAQKNLDLIQRQVVENTRNLYIAINTDVARVRARLRGIESSQSALDATQTGYEVGTRNIVDVLNAQRNLFLSQFQYASARHLYVLDTLRLKQIVGTLSPQDLYDLNQFIDSGIVVSRTTPTTR